jgi:hypothetical protein
MQQYREALGLVSTGTSSQELSSLLSSYLNMLTLYTRTSRDFNLVLDEMRYLSTLKATVSPTYFETHVGIC